MLCHMDLCSIKPYGQYARLEFIYCSEGTTHTAFFSLQAVGLCTMKSSIGVPSTGCHSNIYQWETQLTFHLTTNLATKIKHSGARVFVYKVQQFIQYVRFKWC